jgi:hypothetical protein
MMRLEGACSPERWNALLERYYDHALTLDEALELKDCVEDEIRARRQAGRFGRDLSNLILLRSAVTGVVILKSGTGEAAEA